MHILFVGLALLRAAFATTSTLLTSHFSGAVFTLSLDTQGRNGTLAITFTTGGYGTTPNWLQYYVDTKKLYCWDESWQGYRSMAEYNAKTSGNDVHGLPYGGPSGRSFIATVQYTPSTITTYALPLKAGPDHPFTTPLRMETFYIASPGPNERQNDGPHPHQALLDPTGNSFLTKRWPMTRREFWSPKGNTSSSDSLKLFTVNELGNSISSWSVTYGAGCLALNKTQTISTFVARKPRIIGNFLYAANLNDKLFGNETDSLATYSIDPMTGTATWVEAPSAYAFYLRSFSVNKAGMMVAASGRTSSSVAIISRDIVTGKLGALIAWIQVGAQGTYTNEDVLNSIVWVE
ncbi:hypothetical protein BDZ45DRAFT_709994 [Acephala macrosclerotiorum]|nr:hypothetical protein BDZ45DRAFT_709994 [Acephala macrosclerotiorum]